MNNLQNNDETIGQSATSHLTNFNQDGILNSIKDPIVLLDLEQCILTMNHAAFQLFDVEQSTIVGQSLTHVASLNELVQNIAARKSPNEWSYGEKTYIPHLEPQYDSNGIHSMYTLILTDVTHYKKLNRNQSESMRIVLHDLRSPLTSMQGFASMMEMVGELNERQQHFVSKILSGITQMTALVENVQDAGRYDADSGFYELTRAPCDIGEIAKRIVENHLIPADKTLNISLNVAENLPIVNVDATMLERAINNLVDNAIKYTPDGGSINVAVVNGDNQIVVKVRDSGLGISPQNQSQLFERHVRIHRPEFKKIKGTGLGLFIVRSVARRHGGDAGVESTEGNGSVFSITIPLEGANLITHTP